MKKLLPRIFTLYTLIGLGANVAVASNADDDYFALSLKDLLNIKINTGSLIEAAEKESAAGITIIDKHEIALSGAKNLANLLEQHVPGLLLMTHSEGDKIGLRGQIAAENYKLLLLINGKNITNYVYEGVITEIDQWELGDIERVEVIRGPGSVTYGTGAVAGVINIITKTASTDKPTLSVGVARNDTYRSDGINLQYNKRDDQLGVYGFVSYRTSDGLNNPDYRTMAPAEPSDIRYIGKGTIANAGPQDYLADTFRRPQIKAYLGVDIGESIKTWLRYTQSGQTRSFREKVYSLDEAGDPIALINGRGLQTRSLAMSAEYNLPISDISSFTSSLTLDSQEYIRYDFSNRQFDMDSSNNIRDYAFAQDRLRAVFMYDQQHSDVFNSVIGYEYSAIAIGAPWGKSDDYLWIREGVDIISDANTSVYLQNTSLSGRPNRNKLEPVGDGLDFHTHSQLLEANYLLSDTHKLIYAHRLDFSDVAKQMYSPRLSLVSNFNSNNTLVSTLQRAQRMMPLRAQYLSDKNGDNSKNETLDSLELSFTNTSLQSIVLNLRAYYNEISAVGYTGERLELLSEMELFGLEFDASYKKNQVTLSVNHTYLDPLDVTMNPDLKTGRARNNISFSDYYYNTTGSVPILLESYGDGLNNWPTNITKFLYTHAFINNRLKFHLNAQINWDFDGSYDEMKMYQRAYDTFDTNALSAADQAAFAQQKANFERERYLLDQEDAFGMDYNLNASITYLWAFNQDTDVLIKLSAENLLHSSKRYNVSTGSSRYYPERLEYLEKPEAYSLSLQVNF